MYDFLFLPARRTTAKVNEFFFPSRVNWCSRSNNYYVVKRFGLFSRLLAGNFMFFGRRVLTAITTAAVIILYILFVSGRHPTISRSTHFLRLRGRYKLLLLAGHHTGVVTAAWIGCGELTRGDRVSAHAQLTALQYKLHGSNNIKVSRFLFNPLKQHVRFSGI